MMLASSLQSQQIKPSIPGDVFRKMFAGKKEETLRKDAMWRMTSIAIRYPETSFAKEAQQVVQADTDRADPHAWISDTLKVVGNALRAYPPTDANWEIRREALLLLDYPIHVETGDEFHRAVADFHRPFLDEAFKEIQSAKVTEGVRIWHIYNMGFVVKTKNHTVAFDIFPREPSEKDAWMTFLTESQTKELAKLVDVAFVSHWHSDHANMEFLSAVLEAGKKIVVPSPIDKPYDKLQEMGGIIQTRSTLESGPLDIDGVKIFSYPGFQDIAPCCAISCNVYVVDVDDYALTHNGDNCLHSIYAHIAKNHSIDIALANCWSGTNEYVGTISSKFYITGHENEFQHDSGHRVSYKNTYGNLDILGLAPPWNPNQPSAAVLSCGEDIQWTRH